MTPPAPSEAPQYARPGVAQRETETSARIVSRPPPHVRAYSFTIERITLAVARVHAANRAAYFARIAIDTEGRSGAISRLPPR